MSPRPLNELEQAEGDEVHALEQRASLRLLDKIGRLQLAIANRDLVIIGQAILNIALAIRLLVSP